jgi:hypothetical protein
MRITDAVSAITKSQKKDSIPHCRLSTIWSEQSAPGETDSEYPRPQMRRSQWICLNGYWDYAFTRGKEPPSGPDGQILVPFSPECARSGVEKRLEPDEYLWYSRTVHLPVIPEGKRLLLHFGAVDQRCTIWWNAKMLGSHRNGYLPFSFDVTDFVRKGANRIRIRVQDSTDAGCHCYGKQTLNPQGMFYSAQSGIWQTVWMEWVPEQRIESLRITPLYDDGAVRIELTFTRPERAEIHLAFGHDTLCHYIHERDFAKGSNRIVCDLPVPGFIPWTPEHPYLYPFCVLTGHDRVDSYFAMRKFSVGKDEARRPRLFLNNRPYFFRGVLDQGYWPESLCTAPSDEAMVFDIMKMKELGFNTIRKHMKIEPLRWYYHCDRLGMVVWQDMVSGGSRPFMPFVCYLPTLLPAVTRMVRDNHYHLFSRSSKKGRRQWEQDCLEMVSHLYNCPCIGLWVPFNEGWGQFDALRITEKIRHADPTRLIDHASGWYDQGGGDIRSIHNYFRPLKIQRDLRPCVLTEYGGYTCPVDGHLYTPATTYGYHACKTTGEFSIAFHRLQNTIRKLEKKGLSGAIYTQLSDIETETNGLLTYDRKVSKLQ